MSRSKVRLLRGPIYFVKNYEFIEHTADIGIRVRASSLKGLFINTALAMFDIIAEKKHSADTTQEKIEIKQQAQNPEELFINWLNELLSLSAAKELIFCDFKINKFDKNNLEAVATGSNMADYKVNTEIKAATYHGLKLEERNGRWLAELILDV